MFCKTAVKIGQIFKNRSNLCVKNREGRHFELLRGFKMGRLFEKWEG